MEFLYVRCRGKIVKYLPADPDGVRLRESVRNFALSILIFVKKLTKGAVLKCSVVLKISESLNFKISSGAKREKREYEIEA